MERGWMNLGLGDSWDVGAGGQREREAESRMTALSILVDGSARFSVDVEDLNFGHVGSEMPMRHSDGDIEQADEMQEL